jgi:CHAT domain-containing protein
MGCDGSRPRLYWCPTGVFTTLPLHAAGMYEGPASERLCCKDFVISSYITTVTTLVRLQRAGYRPFPRTSTSLALVAEKRAYESHFPTIYGVVQESMEVAAIARSAGVHNLQQFTDSTSVSTTASALEAANVVHLACHGTQDSADATKSGFCLGDGRLTIEKLMDIKLENAFLAYLSACQTATGDREQPDQAMHLAAAMLYSGFKSVVATMW